jgi:hypothetical protein
LFLDRLLEVFQEYKFCSAHFFHLRDGILKVKELLSTLTNDERCGVMLEFEEASPDKFAQLVADAPHWTEWMV